jgi:hypothetical protein
VENIELMLNKLKSLFWLSTLIFLTSCESDESNEENSIFYNRVSKAILGSTTLNFYYNYETYDCYIIKNGSPSNYINYYYENGILKTSYRNNNSYEYIYENGKIAEIHIYYLSQDYVSEKEIYTYNSNNLITEINKYILNNGNLDFAQKIILEYDNLGNNIKKTYFNANLIITSYEMITCDDKNNPFKNFEPKISIQHLRPFGNNILSIKFYNANDELLAETTSTYEYNSDNFPVKSTTIYPNNPYPSVIDYFYE